MQRLTRQVAIARRRLICRQFAVAAIWTYSAAFAVAAVAILIAKLWYIPVDPWTWQVSWLGGAFGVGTLVAALWTWRHSTGKIAAALEIDRRFELKERVSSTLALREEELSTPAGQALVADALARVERLNVADRFGMGFDRRALAPAASLAIACCLGFLLQDKLAPAPKAQASQAVPTAQVKEAVDSLSKKIAKQKKEAEEHGLEDAELLNKLEKATQELAKKDGLDREHALVKLNDLSAELEKRRQKLAGDEKFKQQLQKMKSPEQGPADALAKAMKDGDFSKAVDEIDKLKKKLEDNKSLAADEKEKLSKQLDQMSEGIKKSAEAHESAKAALERQLAQMNQAGQTAEANKLLEQLGKLGAQDQQMAEAKQLAKALEAAAKQLQEGQMQQAAEQLQELGKQLEGLQNSLKEGANLDEAMQQIADAKAGMSCKECGGKGCKVCQGSNQPGGHEAGRGTTTHDHGEKDLETKIYDSSVKQKVGKGSGVVVGAADGPNLKGYAREAVKAEFESAQSEAADPLSGQRLPKEYRERAGKYFDQYRKEH